MKTRIACIIGLLSLVFSLNMNAQEKKTDYWVGKWDVLVTGLPDGDTPFPITLTREDGKLKGFIGKTMAITSIEEGKKDVTLYFTGGGHEVYLYLEKKSDDEIEGNMMDMFDATGVRVVEKEE
jgi:hypothetical protein